MPHEVRHLADGVLTDPVTVEIGHSAPAETIDHFLVPVAEDRKTDLLMHLLDQPEAKSLWWFVNQEGRCELCLQDPGFEVDLYLACSLATMIYIVRGDLGLAGAIDGGRLEVIGAAKARRALEAWLNLSPLTGIRSQRADALPV